MHDEQTDNKCQETQGTEIEMKAFGQMRQVAFITRSLQAQTIEQVGWQLGFGAGEVGRQQQLRKLSRSIEHLLCRADIHQQQAGRQLRA